MEVKAIIGLCIFLLLAGSVSAAEANYETSSVARIVGESIADMQAQLDNERTDLRHATHTYAPGDRTHEQLQDLFPAVKSTMGLPPILNSGEFNDFQRDELLVHRMAGTADSTSTHVYEVDIPGLRQAVHDGSVLAVTTGEYSGLFLRNIDTFSKGIVTRTPTIASTYHRSDIFVDAVICNLAFSNTLGNLFKNARNSYYQNAPGGFFLDEPLGLTLLSQLLYGNPKMQLTIPNYYSRDLLTDYCQDLLLDDSTYNAQFTTSSTGSSKLNKYITNINYTLTNNTISITGGYIIPEDYTPALPRITIKDEYPLNTIFTDLELEFSDPVEVPIKPQFWEGHNTTNECYPTNESYMKSHATGQTETVIFNINPFRTDCNTTTLFTHVRARVEYTPFSPILITKVEVPEVALPGSTVPVIVSFEQSIPEKQQGILIVTNGITQAKQAINTTEGKATLYLTAPEEGIHNYEAAFVQENQTRTEKSFTLRTAALVAQLNTPAQARGATEATLHLNNPSNQTIQATTEYSILNTGYTHASTLSHQIPPGKSTMQLSFPALETKPAPYEMQAITTFSNEHATSTATIATNYAPTIHNKNVEVQEGQSYSIKADVSDPDNDKIDISIVHKTLPSKLDYDSSGNYEFTVEADDGTQRTVKTYGITVINVNRPPWISPIPDITAQENDTIQLALSYGDPDNENQDPGDDNNLTITFTQHFNENGTWQTGFEDSGTYTITATVSDGEYENSTTFNVTVHNLNRAPVIQARQINASEGEPIEYIATVYDPDNENADAADNSFLNITCQGDLLNWSSNSSYFIQTVTLPRTKVCSITYPYDYTHTERTDSITVTATDGEHLTTAISTITVHHTNRPPTITADNITITEGQAAQAIAHVHDADGNSTVTITYGGVLNTTGGWQTTYEDSGQHTGTITAEDGTTAVHKNITITVLNANRPPTLSIQETYTANEGELIELNYTITDPDNQNNATNDDNILQLVLPEQFNSTGAWNITYDDSGTYNLDITATDGNLTDSKTITITINNTNRPPTPIKLLVAAENSTITVLSATDPDNQNQDEGDDNELTIFCEAPAQPDCTMQLDFNSSGEYSMKGHVSDGEHEHNLSWTMTVLDMNRKPQIHNYAIDGLAHPYSDFTRIHTADSNAIIPLQVNATDPDNDNLTIRWSGAVEATGRTATFTAGGLGRIFEILITASDGDLITRQKLKLRTLDHAYIDDFDGATTNLSQVADFANVHPFVLERQGMARIEFEEPVNLRKALELDEVVAIGPQVIGINSDRMPGLNKSATLTFYNLPDVPTYRIMHSPEAYNPGITYQACEHCTNITRTGNTISFLVPHFSTYKVEAHDKPEYGLSLTDATADISETSIFKMHATLENTGLQPQEVQLSSTVGKAEPRSTTLQPGEQKTITITGTAAKGDYALIAEGESRATSTLRITEYGLMAVSTRVKGEGTLSPRSSIKADLGDELEIKISVRNTGKNTTLENIMARVQLNGLDDDSEDEQHIPNLEPGRQEYAELVLQVPRLTEDTQGEILLTITAETDTGQQILEETYRIRIDKEDHKVSIDIHPSTIRCGKTFPVQTRLVNTGSNDEEGTLTLRAWNEASTKATIAEAGYKTITQYLKAANKTSQTTLTASFAYDRGTATASIPVQVECPVEKVEEPASIPQIIEPIVEPDLHEEPSLLPLLAIATLLIAAVLLAILILLMI